MARTKATTPAALVALSTKHGSDLQLNQLLQTTAHQLGDQLTVSARADSKSVPDTLAEAVSIG